MIIHLILKFLLASLFAFGAYLAILNSMKYLIKNDKAGITRPRLPMLYTISFILLTMATIESTTAFFAFLHKVLDTI